MSLYLRKSFRAGPVRFNVSKSGVGISAGIKGARVGTGPRGSYVHGGRNGLYYRRNLTSKTTKNVSTEGDGCVMVILGIFIVAIGIFILQWLSENPAIFIAGITGLVCIVVASLAIKHHRRKTITNYKNALDAAFVTSNSPPDNNVLVNLKQLQKKLPEIETFKKTIESIEVNVYQALIDKILDDGLITQDETTSIGAADDTLRIDDGIKTQLKNEIFSSAYLEIIEDREISQEEFDRLNNIVEGLKIPKVIIEKELNLVHEFIDTQNLSLPFEPLAKDQISLKIQKSEEAYYQCSAQVLSKRKSNETPTGYEYSLRREGTLILTNKRIHVSDADGGTTNIRYSDIGDVDIDIDELVVEITKTSSTRPIVLKTKAPIYTGRAINLLINTQAGG
jgi:hypothetical protein